MLVGNLRLQLLQQANAVYGRCQRQQRGQVSKRKCFFRSASFASRTIRLHYLHLDLDNAQRALEADRCVMKSLATQGRNAGAGTRCLRCRRASLASTMRSRRELRRTNRTSSRCERAGCLPHCDSILTILQAKIVLSRRVELLQAVKTKIAKLEGKLLNITRRFLFLLCI